MTVHHSKVIKSPRGDDEFYGAKSGPEDLFSQKNMKVAKNIICVCSGMCMVVCVSMSALQ